MMNFREFEVISNDVTVWKQKLGLFCSKNASVFNVKSLGPGKERFVTTLGKHLHKETMNMNIVSGANVDWECKYTYVIEVCALCIKN